MNTNTGHLVADALDIMNQKDKDEYEPVPEELSCAARRKLAGRKEAYVSLTSGGKLSRWAAGRRKARRKAARASRRHNRR